MIARLALAVTALSAAVLAVGCAAPTKATFSVSLKNASTQPVTAWLTKNGGPQEADWLAPEDLSTSIAASTDRLNGVVIPAGKTGEMPPITGKFDSDAMAVLRVYAGAVDFDTMLATGVDSRLRVDVPLREGRNELIVTPSSKLTVERVGEGSR
jgi:hypothetical protein